MNRGSEQTEGKIIGGLTRAYDWLFRVAAYSGHWTDVRVSSLAALCIALREPLGSAWPEAIKKWLASQQTVEGADKGSWGGQHWDTAAALITLKHLGVSERDSAFQIGLNYIFGAYNVNGRCNWYDEPWETSWCAKAILEMDTAEESYEKAERATEWLLGLQESSGRIVSPLYSALFVLACRALERRREIGGDLLKGTEQAVRYILDTASEEQLWTGEAWSNGLVLWALCSKTDFRALSSDMTANAVGWLLGSQCTDGSWGDAESTAYSILGLYHLLKQLVVLRVPAGTDVEMLLYDTLRRNLAARPLCLKRKLIEHSPDGTMSINLSPRVRKTIYAILAIVAALAAIFTLSDHLMELLSKLP